MRYLADPYRQKDACGVGFLATLHNISSRDLMERTFEALKNLAHRGAVDADGRTGDGAGILTPIPKEYYIKRAQEAGVDLSQAVHFAVAMIFYPSKKKEEKECRKIFERVLRKYRISTLWSREVPTDESILGKKAASVKPKIWQKFLACPEDMSLDEFEAELFLIRKEVEVLAHDYSFDEFYIASMSTKNIVHKGLFMGADLKDFYLDLKEEEFIAPSAIFHQRFSTNTFPSWQLAQPFRTLAHNGEINTIRGNRNWMRARESADQARSWVPKDHALSQFIMSGRSDSASFDNALETYVFGHRTILHAIVHMMPEAWQNKADIDPDLKAFYEYHACLSESWDGPAAIAFSDGNIVGTLLDRNGLRPARYKITNDYLFVCSEMGCVDFKAEEVVENGKLSPGTMIAVNIKRKKLQKNKDIKFMLADQNIYQDWVDRWVYKVDEELTKKGKNIYQEDPFLSDEQAQQFKKAFGYNKEDFDFILHPMFKDGKEPIGSMGDDTPLSVFSNKPKLLYTYFKQLFAQVTNPPIDPIRERYVTSLRMYLGNSGNVFEETSSHAHQLRVRGPIVTSTVFDAIKENKEYTHAVMSVQFPIKEGSKILDDTIIDLCIASERAVDDGHGLIILSDRYVDKNHAPIPMLLAVSAVHNHLIRQGKRPNVSLLVETAEARETHHFACLIGYGASIIYPYLALKEAHGFAGTQAVENYIKASEKGILKIMSKMGISVLQSYHASQIFEAIGLNDSLVNRHFPNTPSKVSGAKLVDIAEDYLEWHQEAYAQTEDSTVLDIGGFYRFRRQGEYHAYNPDVVRNLQKAVINDDAEAYKKYCELVNERTPMTLRDLLEFKKSKPINIDSVEEKEGILKRFCTPGISYGAVSKETHETFAIAMNRMDAKSDSGEGGEDPERYQVLPNGDSKSSAIKQVASGRFGVTSYYLSHANELEIKIAQGAKPGEGGQLPGHKVSEDIAKTRYSTPGVTLISPPPHHDIYSIEDLAQLIYDLKQANPKARVCVKLVAEDGVGTIAAGVVKAHADTILISGFDGGTGASPLSSIKHAGLPWELGLAETQQVLVKNALRDRIILRVDGGLKTGKDVVKAAMMGAEEYGFGTASMIAAGCVMVRQCHLNTCPVGVATQDPKLREKYKGTPERVVKLYEFIAEEIRFILAELGFKQLDDIVGRVDLLSQVKQIENLKARRIRLDALLSRADKENKHSLRNMKGRNDWENDEPLDDSIIKDCNKVIVAGKGEASFHYDVNNTHRTIGAKLSNAIVSQHAEDGFQGKLHLNFKGTAGQSFAAFSVKGLHLNLEGEANDYVGKGLSGANVSIFPPKASSFNPEDNIICGNTCLYGATAGKLFVNGRGGERFAVRNSGAEAVIEGVGDHGCEYMTGGRVLILGRVGYNFAAGMTGGNAFVYDPDNELKKLYNPNDVEIRNCDWNSENGKAFYMLLTQHLDYTSSPKAKCLLDNWETEQSRFVSIVPKEIIRLQECEKKEA